jgi:hypothetical protein
MTGSELLAVVGKGLLTGAFSQVSRRGISGLADWVSSEVKRQGKVFRKDDRERLAELLSDQRSLQKALVAQFKTVRRRGVAIVGPSGSGKTSLFNYLRGKDVIQPIASTSERVLHASRFGSRFVRVADTPGSTYQVNLTSETYSYLERSRIDVLVVMLCYGYLDTIGIQGLRRPGQRENSASVADYLAVGLSEELAWLQDLSGRLTGNQKPISYCMIVLNKMDQWSEDHRAVVKYYTKKNPMRAEIDQLVERVCRANTEPSFHPVACAYNSFKGQAPSGAMSAEACVLGLAVLRAEIRRRLLESD